MKNNNNDVYCMNNEGDYNYQSYLKSMKKKLKNKKGINSDYEDSLKHDTNLIVY